MTLLILPGLIALTVRLIPKEIFESCRVEAQSMWVDVKPKRWFYALPIIFVWLLIFWFILRAVFAH